MAESNRTVVATFDSVDRADRAVEQLRSEGFRENEISVVARDERANRNDNDSPSYDARRADNADSNAMGMDMTDQNIMDGTSTGAAVGAGAGLLASAGALAIPGIGPILALGPLAATLSGAAAGGLTGGLVDMGISQEKGREIENDVKGGRAVALIETDDNGAERAQRVMEEAGARDVEIHRR